MTPCAHHLNDDPTALVCTRTDVHTTHVYAASFTADGHDLNEAAAEAEHG